MSPQSKPCNPVADATGVVHLVPKNNENKSKADSSFFLNQWRIKDGIRLSVTTVNEESKSEGEKNNKSALDASVWPLNDLIKAERRIARGSLRPYTRSVTY